MSVFKHPGGLVNGLALSPGWYFTWKHHDQLNHSIYGRNGGNPYATQKGAEKGLEQYQYHAKWTAIWRAAMDNMPLRNPHWEDVPVTTAGKQARCRLVSTLRKASRARCSTMEATSLRTPLRSGWWVLDSKTRWPD